MKNYLLISFAFLQYICYGQQKVVPKTDFNTLFICIDSISYNQLYQSKYIKDTLFLCKEAHQETNTDSYTGKYLIGESSTIEFFKPKNSHQTGNHFGDWGIEFKTRKIHTLNEIIQQSKRLGYGIDTSTTNFIEDSLLIHWYQSLVFKNLKSELSVLEYQEEFLLYLGFTKKQIQQSMSFKEYNSFLSGGKKYPRQFARVTYIQLYADKKTVENLKKFAKLNNCSITKNKIANNETTIEYTPVEKLPEFPIQKIEVSLFNEQKFRIEKISENLYLEVNSKKATLLFKNNN
ncbi:MAG: DUF5829 family protein [Daejeonella sp.]